MRNINPGERSGMIVLALVAIAIVGASFIMRESKKTAEEYDLPVITVVEQSSDSTRNETKKLNNKKDTNDIKIKKKNIKKSKRGKKSEADKTEASNGRRGDPLNDPIPLKTTETHIKNN